MSSLIDRYLYDVSRRLPEDIQSDVERELRTNIEDMLSDNPSDDEIEKILTELGKPSILAGKYRPNPRYLISPNIFDEYISVLKIVAVALASLLAALSIFQILIEYSGNVGSIEIIASLIAGIITGALTGLFQAFFWVTFAFACVEFFSSKKEGKPWSPKTLPEVPAKPSAKIPRTETISGLIFKILFSILFLIGTLRQPPIIAWYEVGKPLVPVFDVDIILNFLPLFILLIIFAFIIAIIKLIKGRWMIGLTISHIIYKILDALITIVFINSAHVFTDAFVDNLAETFHVSQMAMTNYIDKSLTVLNVLIVIGLLSDIGTVIYKTFKRKG